MKLSTRHLNSYFTDGYSSAQLAEVIEKTGIELEGVYSPQPLNTKIVVGLTKKVVQHPNADKLRIVLVDIGADQNLHIVCGAPNVAEDLKVAVATVGAILPDGTEIKEARLRGELSQGMLCSEAELGWSSDHTGIVELPEDYQVGKSLCDIVPVDDILDIKSAANRSDLQSYEGIAREITAQLGIKLLLPKAAVEVAANPKLLKKSDKKVLAFSATSLDISAVGQAPPEVGRVLDAAGVRQISPVVDVTNYINLTVGQPLHAFDADTIKLPLCIRAANRGEKVTTLNGKTNQLTPDDLVVADVNGPIDIAGVMGGAETEVSKSTKTIVLIASSIEPMSVRKTAQRHGIRTDASARYERGLPVELLDRGRSLGLQLLESMGAKVIAGARQGEVESERVKVEVKPERINELLGIDVAPKDMIKHLTTLGFEVSGLAKLRVAVPWWRPDVTDGSDIAEEVIKMVGLDALPATIPAWKPQDIAFDRSRTITDQVRGLLRAAGLFEVTTYSFISEEDLQHFGLKPAKHLKLKNPLSIEQAYMRSTLLPSLVKVLETNQHYAKQFGVSEISRVFNPTGKKNELPNESTRVAVAVMSDYFAAKAPLDLVARELKLNLQFKPSKHDQYHPGRQADVHLDDQLIGSIGQVHPKLLSKIKGNRAVSFAELDLAPIVQSADSQVYSPLSRFPSISRDVAVIMDSSVLWADVVAAINAELPDLKIGYLSRYEGAGVPNGKVSLALRITMNDMEKTLTDKEANTIQEALLTLLKRQFKAILRT